MADMKLPDLNALIEQRNALRKDLDIAAIVDSVLDDVTEIQFDWDSIRGLRYDLVYSFLGTPSSAWVFDSTFTGTGSRMVVIRNINKNEPKRTWQIITHIPEGSEPKVRAIVGWDGTSVKLEWNFLGAPVSGNHKFRIHRGGQLLATLPATALSYLDTTVASGQRYTYEVKYFAN